MSIEKQFNAAVKVIRSLPKNGSFQPSDQLKLTFYAYFKQATEGPNETKKPAFYDIVNRYKWDAWKKLGDMPKEEAMALYVEELKKVIETLSLNAEVSDFLDILGPFYEFLPEEVTNKNSNKSSPERLNSSSAPDQVTTISGTCFTTYDSEGEEFSDTLDTSLPNNDSIPVILQNGTISNSALTSPNKQNVGCKLKQTPDSQAKIKSVQTLGFNEQLTLAIFRLQQSIDRMEGRLDTLESAISQQLPHIQHSTRSHSITKWLFPELSNRSTVLVLAWPLVIYFIIHYIKQIRKK